MITLEEQFQKAARQVNLATEEKDAMRTVLLQHMNPSKKATRSPFVQWYQVSVQFKAQYISMLFIVLLIGSGISAAAEQSLPGEALYQVKSLNEDVRALFTVTPQSKAQLQTELAIRRLEEVEILTIQGKLSTSTKAGVEKDLEGHLAAIKDNVKVLENNNQTDLAADTASAAEKTLKAHSVILDELALNHKNVKDVAKKVNIGANTLALDQETTDSLVASSTLPVDVVINKQKEVQALFEEISALIANPATSTTATSSITSFATSTPELATSSVATSTLPILSSPTIDEKMSIAKDALDKGISKLVDKEYGAAYIFFQKSQKVLNEIKVTLEETKIELLSNVSADIATGTASTTSSTNEATSSASSTILESASSTPLTSTSTEE